MYNKIKLILLIFIILFFITCKSHMFYSRGEKFFEAKDWDNSVKYLVKALDNDPENIDYRLMLGKALISSSQYHYERGKNYFKRGMYKLSLLEFDKSLENNPENMQAVYHKKEVLEKMKELRDQEKNNKLMKLQSNIIEDNSQKLDPKISDKPYQLKFSNIDLKIFFKTLANESGIRFLFHPDFKSKKVYINEVDVSILDVLDRIMLQTKYFYKIIDPTTILIIPDKPANRKKYDELVMRTFFINNGDPVEISKIVKAMTGIKQIIINKGLKTLTIKSTIEKVKLAERIILTNDKAKGEVLIDIEIMEVNKTRINEYGIDLSSYRIGQTFSPSVSEDGSPSVSLNDLKYTDASDFILNLPSINYKLLKSDRNSKIKAKPHIRAIDNEKIELKVGDKVPIPTTSFVPQYGGSQVNNQPITSYQLQDIGISIELTPTIHHDGWVTIEMKFELTFISSPGDIAKNTPPTIGNRTVKSIIRLKDNETAIMAGLLRDTERKSIKSIPLIDKIPILKSLFSGNSNEIEQTDIILTITPRIIRYPEINKSDLEYIWVGTALKPGLRKSAPPKFYTEIKEEKRKKEKEFEIENKIMEKKEKIKVENKNIIKKIDLIKNKDEKHKKPDLPAEVIFNMIKSPLGMKMKLNHGKGIKFIKVELDFDSDLMVLKGLKRSRYLIDNKIKSLLFKRFNNKEGKIIINITFDEPIDIERKEILNFTFESLKEEIGTVTPKNIILLDENSKVIETGFKVSRLEE